jgi:DNA-binding LacI/PurR family transcriptional regulator
MIGGMSEDPMNFPVPVLRQQGFVDGLADAGLSFDPMMIEGGNFGLDGGHEAMSLLLERPSPPTAVFAMSDEMAFGALMALNERGMVAGRDVSIMGVDDHEFSRVVDLTTVRQPVAEHGATAGRLLLDALARLHSPSGATEVEPDAAERHVLAPIELIVRSTTGPVPIAAVR